jgi:elongation factor Ts
MHIAACNPKFIRKEDIPAQTSEREKEAYRTQVAASGKLPHVIETIVDSKMKTFCEKVCLYEQLFVKDQAMSISQLLAAKGAKFRENLVVHRFALFNVGDTSVATDDFDPHPRGALNPDSGRV